MTSNDPHLSASFTRAERWFAALLTSALAGMAISRLDLWPLEWVVLVPILAVGAELNAREAFRWGWLTGALAHLILYRWIAGTVVRFSNLPLPLATLTLLLFAAGHGFVWAVWLYLAARLKELTRPRIPYGLAATASYVACAGFVPQLFPWWVGMTQYHFAPLAQIADLGGVAMVSALVVAANAVLADLYSASRERRPFAKRSPLVFLGVLALALGYGAVRLGQIRSALAEAPAIKVGLAQPNVPIEIKRSWVDAASRVDELEALLRKGAAERTELLIVPESALPFKLWGGAAGRHNVGHFDVQMSARLARLVQETGVPLVASTALSDEKGWYNSALLLAPAGGKTPAEVSPPDLIRARYDKMVLLWFGERLPFGETFPILYEWIRGVGRFRPGEGAVTFETDGLKMGVGICYEAILANFTRRSLRGGEQVLLNLTNDAWFGEGDERHQHWTLALWRAIENRVWLLRSTNTGRTSIVNPAGEEIARAPESTYTVLVDDIRPISSTSLYRAAGPWFEWLCALLVLAGVVKVFVDRKRAESGA